MGHRPPRFERPNLRHERRLVSSGQSELVVFESLRLQRNHRRPQQSPRQGWRRLAARGSRRLADHEQHAHLKRPQRHAKLRRTRARPRHRREHRSRRQRTPRLRQSRRGHAGDHDLEFAGLDRPDRRKQWHPAPLARRSHGGNRRRSPVPRTSLPARRSISAMEPMATPGLTTARSPVRAASRKAAAASSRSPARASRTPAPRP